MKQYFAIIVVCLTALLIVVSAAHAEKDCYTKSEVDSLLRNYRPSIIFSAEQFPDSITFCGITVDLTDPEYRERFEYELYLFANQTQLILFLLRGNRYFPVIDQILDLYKVPLDLRYVCVIESGLRAKVGSPAGAKGWWQFMKKTGQAYGLVINGHIDQRYDLIASTHAAARYLDSLHALSGDWYLALAAYNWGRYNVNDAIDDQDTSDYFMLEMPNETMRYVVRAAAIKWVMEHPEHLGIQPERIQYWDGLYPADTATVTVKHRLPVSLVMEWLGPTPRAVIERLNPELVGDKWTPGHLGPVTYHIKLPPGTKAAFQTGLRNLIGKNKK